MNYIELVRGYDDVTLVCPVCSGEYLHQNSVKAFWRDSEDGPANVVTSTTNSVSVLREEDGKIPGRRNCIDIDFWCEAGHNLTMRILQHKGCTYLSWIKIEIEEDLPIEG